VARLLVLASMLLTLSLGGASALRQDAQDGYWAAHNGLNALSDQVTSGIVNLHTDVSGSSSGS
jgi:hypothetical protein